MSFQFSTYTFTKKPPHFLEAVKFLILIKLLELIRFLRIAAAIFILPIPTK